MDDEPGRLIGGPHDGVEFTMNGKWRAFEDGTTRLATYVLVSEFDDVHPGWPDSVRIEWPGAPRIPASRYDLDSDDPGYLYRYAGEV